MSVSFTAEYNIIINGDSGCSFWQPVQADSQPKSSGLVLGRRPLGAILHSSNEPGELSQWLCYDDSTINIVLVIIIIIIICSQNMIQQFVIANILERRPIARRIVGGRTGLKAETEVALFSGVYKPLRQIKTNLTDSCFADPLQGPRMPWLPTSVRLVIRCPFAQQTLSAPHCRVLPPGKFKSMIWLRADFLSQWRYSCLMPWTSTNWLSLHPQKL